MKFRTLNIPMDKNVFNSKSETQSLIYSFVKINSVKLFQCQNKSQIISYGCLIILNEKLYLSHEKKHWHCKS